MKKLFVFIVITVTLFTGTACAVMLPSQPAANDGSITPTVTAGPDATVTQPVPPNQIVNRTWRWVRTQMSSGDIYSPIKQDAFTITLGEDGKVTGTTDCNNFFGSYTIQDPLLSFGELASTKMYCEGSQETDFLRYLGEVQSFLIVDNQLVLELKYGSGQVIFE